MQTRVYVKVYKTVVRPSVCLSVQQIWIDSCRRHRSAANAGSVMQKADGGG